MFPGKMLGFVLGAMMTGSMALAPSAGAQSNCDWYAATAIKQQQKNEKGKCGFSGSGWSSDLRSHIAWCSGVSPDKWKQAAAQREQQLAGCGGR